MAQAYLFVHFREKTTPDGEQVYFGISRDDFHWEAVNDGRCTGTEIKKNSDTIKTIHLPICRRPVPEEAP